MTSSKSVQHLKAQMLIDAVNSNLDAIDPINRRLPEPLPPVMRPRYRWPWRTVRLGAVAVVLVVASAGVARWRASARAVPNGAVAAVPVNAPAAAPDAAPDPSLLLQQVPANVLGLSVRRVIVDAGHGGDNLGTSSAKGINEKDVTLDIAERVRQLIVQRGFEAVMTRTTDETRSLLDRADTANRRHGDIFVSIHLNSLRPSSERGIETYYLGPSNGPELDAIAAEENRDPGRLPIGHPVIARKDLHGHQTGRVAAVGRVGSACAPFESAKNGTGHHGPWREDGALHGPDRHPNARNCGRGLLPVERGRRQAPEHQRIPTNHRRGTGVWHPDLCLWVAARAIEGRGNQWQLKNSPATQLKSSPVTKR